MAFGLSFGAKKGKTSGTTSIDKTTDTTQLETGSKATSGVTTSTGTSTTTGTQTGQTTNQSDSVGSQTNQQQSTLFSQGILSGLEGIIGDLFGSQARTPMSLADNFDKEAFVESGYRAAESRATDDTNIALNSMFDRIGGRDDQNSMATLLANRARGDAAAQLAGVRANLEAQGEGIERENFAANLAAQGQSQGFLNNLLTALKGGTAATSGSIQTAESTAQSGTSAQQSAETTQQQQTQTQQLLELLQNALTGTEHVVGTEKTKGKQTEMGGGFSLGF
jgi:hypothetical protein